MEFRQLRYFVAAVRETSLARAAKKLGISQPALTRAIQSLETELNQLLLQRSSTGVKPTDAGLRLLERGEPIVQAFDDLKAAFTHPAS